jgi:hypothetical protein
MARLEIKGLDKLEAALKKNVTMNEVKMLVRKHGTQMNRNARDNADFKKGYATGTTKRSIHLEFEDGGMTVISEPTTEYAPYIKIGRNIWKHIFKNRAKSVKILSVT